MLGQLSSVGMAFVLALVLGFAAGYWLDEWWGTRPWLTFLGFFLGLAAGVLNVYRVLQATSQTTGGAPPSGGSGTPPTGHGTRRG